MRYQIGTSGKHEMVLTEMRDVDALQGAMRLHQLDQSESFGAAVVFDARLTLAAARFSMENSPMWEGKHSRIVPHKQTQLLGCMAYRVVQLREGNEGEPLLGPITPDDEWLSNIHYSTEGYFGVLE
jgi:hypothetical protein